MAQIKDLLVLGKSTFLDSIKFNKQVDIFGNAASMPLRVRGIVGSNGEGVTGDLYLQYGANSKVMLGNSGGYYISAAGDYYSGKSANATNADYATVAGKISDLSTTDQASSSATWRYVWMSYSNNTTGRPAYDDRFAIQTSTGTLKAPTFSGNLVGTSAVIDGLNVARQQTYNNLTHSGNEFTFAAPQFQGAMYINYRTASGSTDGNITSYIFCNGNKTTSGVTIDAAAFSGKAATAGHADTATAATTSSYPAGFSSNGGTISWGTLKYTDANGYQTVARWDSANGGSVAFADGPMNNNTKKGQTSMQIDGYYYQEEGTYQVLDNRYMSNMTQAPNGSGTATGLVKINTRLVVKGNGSSYNEGIRIVPASNGWSNIYFSDNRDETNHYSTGTNGWLLGRRGAAGSVGAAGDFTIECNNSNGSGLTLYAAGGGYLNGRFGATGGSFGYNNTSYALSTESFICSSWIRTVGATGWYNETYGGGMYMVDTTYVRVYNDKQFYVSNGGQHAIYTAGGFASAKTNGPVLSTYYNDTWYGDTIQTHGNGNLSISAPGGNLYLAYARGVTYFGGGTYCIDRSGYFNGTSAAAYYLPTSITFADSSSPWTPATIYSSIGSGGRIKKGTWDYAGNGYVAKGNVTNGSKCPFFAIDLAGTTVIQAANSSSVYTQIYITAPTSSGVTGAATNEMVFYNYHGDDYSPAWTRVLTNRNYNSYAPTLTGTGASGTWGINITGNAATATLPSGFTSHNGDATWGNQTGTTVTCWNEANGGSVDWRRDNPSGGKISLKVDGRFYGNEGNNPAMLLTNDGSYWGMGSPDGDASVWIRTTSQGIIPYASKSAGSGTCYLGTSTWYFGYAYIDNIYGSSFSGNAATATKATKDGNGDTISSTYLKLSGGTMTGNITLGSYGMLGFGNTIPATHKEVTSFTPEANAVWLATTGGGGESAGICLDGASIRFWTPNDSVIEFLDSDTAAGTNYASVKFGTVTGGTWNGSAIGVAYGGTGVTSWTTNRLIYASGATTLSTSSHYISSSTVCINGTNTDYTFYVNGNSFCNGTITFNSNSHGLRTLRNNYTNIGASDAGFYWGYINNLKGSGSCTYSSFNATSDARLKTNFRSVSFGDIFDLPIYKFDFIAGEANKIGCMAQDLQQICPEIVHQGEDGYLSIEESKIVYLLLDKMKEMQKEINELKEGK